MNNYTFYYLKTTNRKPKVQVFKSKLRQPFRTLRYKELTLRSLKTKQLARKVAT